MHNFPGAWPFGADGGLGGGLSVASRDGWFEITDARADVLDIRNIDDEHGATTEHPIAPQDLANLGTTWSTTVRI